MTAIIYSKKHKQVAFESRMTLDTRIVSDNINKCITREGVKFIAAGAPAHLETLIAMYFDPTLTAKKLECQAIIIDSGIPYVTEHISDCSLSVEELTYNDGLGSGSPWALAALDFGKTPKEAIKYATKKDMGCGGRIRTINL